MKKITQDYWFFRMGMLDGYDYIFGDYPLGDDDVDEFSIEDWLTIIQHNTI